MTTTKTTYREPGAGAIEFARKYVDGLSHDDALPIIKALLTGEIHDTTDKRVKRCNYCGYWWWDDSLRNTKRTCSDECKRGIKTIQRREQRARQELLNPKPQKPTLMDDYLWWLEYPFWVNEYSMIKIGWKYEKPMKFSKMDYIEAKNKIYGEGNRRIPKRAVEYHGDNRDKF